MKRKVKTGRKPRVNKLVVRSELERKFLDYCLSNGWAASRRGWPDYFCFRADGRVCAVNMYNRRGRRSKRDQSRVLAALSAAGVPCYQVTPSGLSKITPHL